MRKILLLFLLTAVAMAAPNLNGSWTLVQSNGSGTMKLEQYGTMLSGTADWPGLPQGKISGKLDGNKVEFVITWSSSLHGIYKATLSPDGRKMVDGTTHPKEGGAAASFTATRR